MYIYKIAIENYKSYHLPQEIQLTDGFNVIVGPNNAGKTALVEALSLKFENKPHRSEETIPTAGNSVPSNSNVFIGFKIPNREFREMVWTNWRKFIIRRDPSKAIDPQRNRVANAFLFPSLHIDCTYSAGSFTSFRIIEMDAPVRTDMGLSFTLEDRDGVPKLEPGNLAIRDENLVAYRMALSLSEKIYYFRAERFHVGQCPVGTDTVLKPDASNLPEVLHKLQTSNPSRFAKLLELVKSIFPDVKQITIPPIEDDPRMVKIYLWHVDPSSERADLAVPLQESGTGLGQVLAILYVAIMSPFSRPIIIDEPQSFLHPTAIRKLFDILQQDFSQHQYIVTTHSPLVISATGAKNIILLEKQGTSTQVRLINPSQANELRTLLAAVGARLSDVFGAENILWVEGRTEENCFPVIVSGLLKRPLLGTAILGVLNVGDFEKRAENVFRIYRRLSEGVALLPPAIGFVFDREGRSETQQQDLIRESAGQIRFLPRRMYENYLINAEAITFLISKLEDFSEQPITLADVTNWIESNWGKETYFDKIAWTLSADTWLEDIHGKKFLKALFESLSENRYAYDPIRDGMELTTWLVKNQPEELSEVAELLQTFLV